MYHVLSTHENTSIVLRLLDMEVVFPGANGHATPATAVTSVDPNLVVEHLVDLLEITLGASAKDLERSGSLLSSPRRQETVLKCTRFASESQVVLYVSKDLVTSEQANGINGTSGIV